MRYRKVSFIFTALIFVLLSLTSFIWHAENEFNLFDLNDVTRAFFFADSAEVIGKVGQPEISGLSRSTNFSENLWGINDSGNGNIIYLYSKSDAKLQGIFRLNGAANRDWEELAFGKATDLSDESFLYVGDIGDNRAERKVYVIYGFKEPKQENISDAVISDYSPDIHKTYYMYEDGPRDAEAMFVDPLTEQFVLISKREQNVGVYTLPLLSLDSTLTAVKVAKLPLHKVVAADISSDGMEIILKTYESIFYWKRKSEIETIHELFQRAPYRLAYNPLEPQGESICITDEGYYTLSEKAFGLTPLLYYYAKKE